MIKSKLKDRSAYHTEKAYQQALFREYSTVVDYVIDPYAMSYVRFELHNNKTREMNLDVEDRVYFIERNKVSMVLQHKAIEAILPLITAAAGTIKDRERNASSITIGEQFSILGHDLYFKHHGESIRVISSQSAVNGKNIFQLNVDERHALSVASVAPKYERLDTALQHFVGGTVELLDLRPVVMDGFAMVPFWNEKHRKNSANFIRMKVEENSDGKLRVHQGLHWQSGETAIYLATSPADKDLSLRDILLANIGTAIKIAKEYESTSGNDRLNFRQGQLLFPSKARSNLMDYVSGQGIGQEGENLLIIMNSDVAPGCSKVRFFFDETYLTKVIAAFGSLEDLRNE